MIQVSRWIFFYFNSIFSPSVYIHYIHILLHDDLHFIHGYRVIIYLSVSFCTGESKKRNSFLFVQRTVIELNDDDSIILPPNHNVSVFYTYIPIYIMYCARVNNYTTLYYYIRIAQTRYCYTYWYNIIAILWVYNRAVDAYYNIRQKKPF